LTYEEIGTKLSISPQQVHKIEKEAINKLFKRLFDCTNYTPVEITTGVCEYFGVNPDQIYKKLDESNKAILLRFVQNEYGMSVPGFKDVDVDSIEDLFG
jgi:hypothetical protein